MIKIFDCSNSLERPANRGYGGPFENEIIKYLKKYCYKYDCSFVNSYKKCDIIITNDVFPKEIQNTNKPKLKRMDGVFFLNELKWRNESLNESAQIADHVIFISEFSKSTYFKLYNKKLKSHSVSLNQVDPSDYYQLNIEKEFDFISIATSWEREEKRLNDLIKFIDKSDVKLGLIGNTNKINLSKNIVNFNYLNTSKQICKIINKAKAFINFSFSDAAPKTVLQGLCCGLPVLYANSGGVSELVKENGIGVKDSKMNNISIPELDINEVLKSFDIFKTEFDSYKNNVLKRDNEKLFKNMLDHYFNQIKYLVGK